MHEALTQLMSYLRATWRRRWYIVVVAWLVSIGGWVWVYTLPDRYEAAARVFVDTQSLLRPLLSGLAVQPNFDQQVSMMTRTLISRPNLEKVARMTDLDLRAKSPGQTEELLNELAAHISLQGTGRDNLYTIAYQNRDPNVAKRVVQALLTIFMESSLGGTRKDIRSSQKFIEGQLKDYEDKLNAADKALTEFKRNHMGTMPGEGGGYYSQLSAMNDQINQAQLDLREAENRRDQMKRQLSDTGEQDTASSADLAPPADPVIDARIKSLQSQLDDLRLRYTDQYPDVIGIKRLIAQLEEQKKREAKLAKSGPSAAQAQNPVYQQLTIALAEADANVAALRARLNEYQGRYARLKAAADRIPLVDQEYKALMRDYSVYQSNYQSLLARRESAAMSGELETKTDVVDFRVIDPPRVPLTPAWPNRPLLLSLVLLGAIAGGVAVAFMVGQIRRTVDDRRALREISGFPLLGSVTLIQTDEAKRKKRKGLLAYILSFVGLLGAYGVLVALQLILARTA